MTTADIFRCAAEVAAALSSREDLPELGSFGVWSTGVIMRGAHDFGPWANIATAAEWARVFDTDVEISLRYGSVGSVDVRFELAGHRIRVTDTIGTAEAYQLGALLRMPLSSGTAITVTPDRIATALTELATATVQKGQC